MKNRRHGMALAEFCDWARKHRTRWFFGCELWTGALTRGYGQASFNGRRRLVHRLIAEHYHGPAPDGRPCALHICHNPACINPAHLYWGTQADNMNDKMAAGRHGGNGDPVGERNGNAKLTDLRVRLARRLGERGAPIAPLARWLGVSRQALSDAVRRKTWRHVR